MLEGSAAEEALSCVAFAAGLAGAAGADTGAARFVGGAAAWPFDLAEKNEAMERCFIGTTRSIYRGVPNQDQVSCSWLMVMSV